METLTVTECKTDRLFLVAAILQPTANERKAGERAKLILPLEVLLAADEGEARLRATHKLDVTDDVLSRVEVLVRPF